MAEPFPTTPRAFALEVVRRLRAEGFVAYWAGGCVRDLLLTRTPKDYDVATDARPAQIRDIFGRRNTLAIGAAFGVITVVGPRSAGNVEVATFRQDADYSDGRHPDHVTFSSAEEDARRRDFTINGLFYDPLEQRVIDFVGGQEDVARRTIRAIGRPEERFREDKLRLLRAIRFTAAFGFALDPATRAAIAPMARQIAAVSPERIAMEMRRMLVDAGRSTAVQLLVDTGLAEIVLPEIVPVDADRRAQLEAAMATLDRLAEPRFPLALAALLAGSSTAEGVEVVGRRWRLSNREIERAAWLVENHATLQTAQSLRWSQLQPLLVHEGMGDLLALTDAAAPQCAAETAFCRAQLERPRDELDPPPLLTGDDLLAHGLRPGPRFAVLLARLRTAQLDGLVRTRDEALAAVDRWAAAGDNGEHQGADMDKKAKKRLEVLRQRVHKLEQQIAGMRKQNDEPEELRSLEQQLAAATDELSKLKE